MALRELRSLYGTLASATTTWGYLRWSSGNPVTLPKQEQHDEAIEKSMLCFGAGSFWHLFFNILSLLWVPGSLLKVI